MPNTTPRRRRSSRRPGRKKAVTIATNMAGRGTDILLGGNPEFLTLQTLREKGLTPDTLPKPEYDAIREHWLAVCRKEHDEVVRSADCTSSAPSGTRPGASTTSCAAVPAGRATRVLRASTSRSKTT